MPATTIIYLMGIYMLGGGLALLLTPGRVKAMVESIEHQPLLSYVAGAVMAPLGAAILLWYHDFSTAEHALVTVLGAGMLIEGWFLMALPKTFMSFAKPFLIGDPATRIMGTLTLLLAGVAIWYGYPR